MPLDKLNAALIAAIQNGTPEYTNPAAILTDKLNIGREAAYRRLRGEVPFTGSSRKGGAWILRKVLNLWHENRRCNMDVPARGHGRAI